MACLLVRIHVIVLSSDCHRTVIGLSSDCHRAVIGLSSPGARSLMQNTELLEYLTYIVAIIAKSPDLAVDFNEYKLFSTLFSDT